MIQRKVLEIIRDVYLEQGTELKVHELFARGTDVDDLDYFQRCYSLFLNGHVPKLACSEGKKKSKFVGFCDICNALSTHL